MKRNRWKILVQGIVPILILFLYSSVIFAGEVSVEVQENIDILIKTNKCVSCNLAGADLNRLNLSEADLRQADLTGATFFLADLSDADLSGAVLRGTKFGGADLANADLRGADLRGASISGAYTVGSKIDGNFVSMNISDDADLKDIKEKVFIPDDSSSKELPEQKKVAIAKRRDFDTVPPVIERPVPVSSIAGDLTAPPVKKVSPVGQITIGEVAENHSIMDKSSTTIKQEQETVENMRTKTEESLESVSFEENSELPAAEHKSPAAEIVEESEIEQPKEIVEEINVLEMQEVTENDIVDETIVVPEKIVTTSPQDSEIVQQDEQIEPAILSDQFAVERLLDTNKCYGCKFGGVDFSGKNLDDADLESADFDGANLEDADLAGANLKGVSFRNANMKNVDLRKADLYKADFSGADLTGANLDGAKIDETNFSETVGYQMDIMTESQ